MSSNDSIVSAGAALFRPAAIAAQRNGALASIVLVAPLGLRALTICFVALGAALAAVFYFGSYTAHRTLRGALVTERGVAEIRSPQPGIVIERRVREGDRVARGEVLYVISSERTSSARGATEQLIGEELAARRRSLVEQIENARSLARLETESFERTAAGLREERRRIDETALAQAARASLAREVAERYERLRAAAFVSDEQLLAKRADLLDQQSRSHALERDRASVERQIGELDSRVAIARMSRADRLAELEGAIVEIDLRRAENEARRAITIAAPNDGVVTGVGADVGEPVDGATPLAYVVPEASPLRAELYAPSRAAGFLSAGQRVLLRYEAFPYQKFGRYGGSIAAISATSLAPRALGAPAVEPVYRVTVELERQTVTTYGEMKPLRPGMSVEADVLLETRRLYEWIFEPLYALSESARGAPAPGT